MVNKKLSFKILSLTICSIFFSLNCYSGEVEQIADQAQRAQGNKPSLKTECSPNCEKISRVALYFVDPTNIFSTDQKDSMLIKLKKGILPKRKDLNFVSLNRDKVDHYEELSPVKIKVDITFNANSYDSESIKMQLKIIYPGKFYTNEFLCPVKEKLACVNEHFEQEVEKGVQDYLFKPVFRTVVQ